MTFFVIGALILLRPKPQIHIMVYMKYFGTDGIRGVYGGFLTDGLAYRAGLAAGAAIGTGTYIIGCDTRESCPALLTAYSKGLAAAGCEALYAGILPTPAISALTVKRGAKCGVMISASHNPPEYNGIKIFNGYGIKLTEEEESAIEAFIDNPPVAKSKGTYREFTSAKNEYAAHIISMFQGCDFRGIGVALDCAFGAAGAAAPEIFEALGFKVKAYNFDIGKGKYINADCGALYPETVASCMKDEVLGLSFDGDADRLSIVWKKEILDGDSVIYNLSKAMFLKDNAVVGTILNNLALQIALEKDGVRLIRVPVGDKYIAEEMFKKGYDLGGEQSGHYIIRQCGATGDGIAASLFFIKSLLDGKGGLKEPCRLDLCPQGAIAEYAAPSILEDEGFKGLTQKYVSELGSTGRIITRMSGTEPKVRVMVECQSFATVEKILSAFKNYIKSVQ